VPMRESLTVHAFVRVLMHLGPFGKPRQQAEPASQPVLLSQTLSLRKSRSLPRSVGISKPDEREKGQASTSTPSADRWHLTKGVSEVGEGARDLLVLSRSRTSQAVGRAGGREHRCQ
jgi:hypothetical protein